MTRLIDADALFKDLDGMMEVSPTGYIHGDAVADMINDAPTVEAEPVRHGRWIFTGRKNVYGGIEVKCSQCENSLMIQHIEQEKYCCFCGARMDAE